MLVMKVSTSPPLFPIQSLFLPNELTKRSSGMLKHPYVRQMAKVNTFSLTPSSCTTYSRSSSSSSSSARYTFHLTRRTLRETPRLFFLLLRLLLFLFIAPTPKFSKGTNLEPTQKTTRRPANREINQLILYGTGTDDSLFSK